MVSMSSGIACGFLWGVGIADWSGVIVMSPGGSILGGGTGG